MWCVDLSGTQIFSVVTQGQNDHSTNIKTQLHLFTVFTIALMVQKAMVIKLPAICAKLLFVIEFLTTKDPQLINKYFN